MVYGFNIDRCQFYNIVHVGCFIMTNNRLLEVCVDNIHSAVEAVKGGAHRLEICSSLMEGGLTPSTGLVTVIKYKCPLVKLFIMIRCNAGSEFIYSNDDIDVMLQDINIFKNIGVDGFVFGSLTSNGLIDHVSCKKIISASNPLPVTFHRAFDVCQDPYNSLEVIINLGFKRVLTSGRESCVASDKGCCFIKKIKEQVQNRIIIMPGCGINPDNVEKLLSLGLKEIHASCLMKIKNDHISNLNIGKKDNREIFIINRNSVEKIVSFLKE